MLDTEIIKVIDKVLKDGNIAEIKIERGNVIIVARKETRTVMYKKELTTKH